MTRYRNALRLLSWGSLLLLCCFALVGPAAAQGSPAAAEELPAGSRGLLIFLRQVVTNLLNSHALMETLRQPEYTLAALVTVNVIVFVETGLLIGFFLPGDSLLVMTGLICAGPWQGYLLLLLASVSLSAVLGDSVGYSIGYRAGPRIFCRQKSLFFRQDHLFKAQQFYDRHGGKTIIIARFMPILRTFAPVVAGVARMDYRRFLLFNICGGVGWVVSMILIDYFLPSAINPLLRPLLGETFRVEDHIEKVVILVVLASVAPMFIAWLRHKRPTAAVRTPEMAAATK